jgi:hypothetical protein
MRRTIAAIAVLALAAGCGGEDAPAASEAGGQPLEGDAALISAAQKVSDALGGCVRPEDAPAESKVVGLENGAIVMLACSQGAYSFTNRLFAVRAGEPPALLSLPDYDANGWFASDQVSMPELDAGTGVLTTYRKSAGHGGCGSEGRYKWDGVLFALEELHWRDCAEPAEPPFPTVWPAQQSQSTVEPGTATPAP